MRWPPAAPRSSSTRPSSATFYKLAGFRMLGRRAVRIDILERLADLIRPALAWKPGTGQRPDGAFDGSGFTVTPPMMSILGATADDMEEILKGLGYRADAEAGGRGQGAARRDRRGAQGRPRQRRLRPKRAKPTEAAAAAGGSGAANAGRRRSRPSSPLLPRRKPRPADIAASDEARSDDQAARSSEPLPSCRRRMPMAASIGRDQDEATRGASRSRRGVADVEAVVQSPRPSRPPPAPEAQATQVGGRSGPPKRRQASRRRPPQPRQRLPPPSRARRAEADPGLASCPLRAAAPPPP